MQYVPNAENVVDTVVNGDEIRGTFIVKGKGRNATITVIYRGQASKPARVGDMNVTRLARIVLGELHLKELQSA